MSQQVMELFCHKNRNAITMHLQGNKVAFIGRYNVQVLLYPVDRYNETENTNWMGPYFSTYRGSHST